jgi:hypothetical protein
MGGATLLADINAAIVQTKTPGIALAIGTFHKETAKARAAAV